MTPEQREPIAIVGIGCRLPGGVIDPQSLWQLLTDGVDAITTIPPDRFDLGALYDERPATPGRIMSKWGGFVDDIEGFDAGFFEMAPREAERLDPQQRLLLETAWEALDDAGATRQQLAETNAGVYVGLWTNEYEGRLIANREHIDFHMTTGSGRYAASGRLSYFFDLLGPSVTVDTACSSSLVAIHLACNGLLAGECDVALAGGANVIVDPYITIAYSQSRMMAADGHCKFGDADANGYVRSDGAVMIALKRLSTAMASGDHIYALIRGSAVTNDGRSSGFMATPGLAGQQNMLRRAYANAGVDPRSVQYVEAHGTGTAAGDPVEVGAIGSVVGALRDQADPCLVGSIKTNVGHTEGAAGAAGLVKLALALQHGEIPASLHVNEPNPTINWDELGVRVNREHRAWPSTDGRRRGGVSAFGIAGTNAHVVLEQAPSPAPARVSNARSTHLLAISAKGPDALNALAHRYVDLLDSGAGSLADLVATAARRNQLPDRLTVVGNSRAQLAAELRRKMAELYPGTPNRAAPGRRVVFVFPGQGSQWPGMARELLAEEPEFARAMGACDVAIQAEAGWSPIAMLIADDPARLDDIDVVQPLLFAIQVSLAALWASWGITPHAVVGHSMGEVAAAHVAGALNLTDATSVICRRSALLRRISGHGAMALVDLPLAEALSAIDGLEASLSIAVSNSPRSTVLSGEPGALQSVLAQLEAADVFCRPVKVDVASHSPQVDPLLDELRLQLADLKPQASAIPFRSTVAGRVLEGESLNAEYWAANLRQTVLFGDAIAELARAAPTAFVELSPHPILMPSIEQVVRDVEPAASVAASMRRDEPEVATMLAGLGTLHESGVDVDLSVVTGQPSTHVALPTYPWQHERHWYEPVPAAHHVNPLGRSRHNPVRHGELLHEVCWRASPVAPTVDVGEPRRWVVYATPAAGGQLVAELRAVGDECVVVEPGTAYTRVGEHQFTIHPDSVEQHRRVFDEVMGRAGPALTGVIYLWGAGLRTDLSDAASFGCLAPLAMLKVLGATAASPRVWIATRGAFAAAPMQGLLWGVGRVAATEVPALQCTLVDLEPAWNGEADLFTELQRASIDHEVSFLTGERRVSRLVRSAGGRSDSKEGSAIRADATYLVSGGTGGLGLAVAERLVDRGARHIALLARRAATPGVERAISSMLDRGATVRLFLADVSDAAQLDAALAAVRSSMPPLRGIVHAAGVLADSTIDAIDESSVRAVLAPKLHGAWNLHAATLDDPLDHFLLFSSVAGLLGLAGQSNYAAGNAFLDSLAAHRRSLGRPAISIQWGPWAAIGLAASATNRGARLADLGLGSLDPADALDVFDELLDHGRSDIAVMEFDADLWVTEEPSSALLLSEIAVAPAGAISVEHASSHAPRMAEQIVGASLADRIDVAEACVRALVGRVLKLPEDRIDSTTPFGTLGFDSLMSLELHNWIEREFGLKLSATVAWNYPSVKELSAHLLAQLTNVDPPAQGTVALPGTADSDVESLAADVSGLSDDEALDALMGGGAR